MTPVALELTSDAFGEGDPIPERFPCDGPDVSPSLAFRGVLASCRPTGRYRRS